MDPHPGTEGADGEKAPQEAVSDWQPGPPSLRTFLPSIIGGAVVPLTVYYLVRSHVHSDATALIIAGIFPAAWIVVQFVRQRRIDPVGAVVLFGFAVGVITSTLLGGNTYVLKVRDSAFTAIFGIVCLVSVFTSKRPAIFFVGRYLSAGNDPERVAAYDELHTTPTGQHAFRVLTVVWGIALLLEAGARIILALPHLLSTGAFLAISPVITGVTLGGAFVFTVWYANRAIVAGAAEREATHPDPPPVPDSPAATKEPTPT
jgi:hypothetical protein